jgi:hypothetical protein
MASPTSSEKRSWAGWPGIIAILLATLLWLLVKFNQSYTTTIQYPARIASLPLQVAPDEDGIRRIKVNCEGLGSRLFVAWLRRNRDTLSMKYEPRRRGSPYVLLGAEESAFLRRQLPTGVRMLNYEPDSLQLKFETRTNKRVPLRISNSFLAPFGYRVDSFTIRGLDSVKITGPAEKLEGINEWYTSGKSIAVQAKPGTYGVEVDTTEGLEIAPPRVMVYVRPRRYIEVEVQAELSCPDAPKGVEVKFFPPKLQLYCVTPLDFRRNAPQRINLTVPFTSLDPARGVFYPDPQAALPPELDLIRWEPRSFSFVIQEEQD